ncbi:hypothetical protein V1514DRAFT_283649 [Lipomyces japonicus]|uniref:uncharacterized protein n=1 Tax=Lipomyces japonicus TaxID=56871 RepID=UPI0034CE55CC
MNPEDEDEDAAATETHRLNKILDHLNDMFPETDVGLLRRLMRDHAGPSQLYAIVESILSSSFLLAKSPPVRQKALYGVLTKTDRFRSASYRAAVNRVLRTHFNMLHHSTIDNVLEENNHALGPSLASLEKIAAEFKNRWSLSNLLGRFHRGLRNRGSNSKNNKQSLDMASLIGHTGSPELDADMIELDQARIRHVKAEDEALARRENENQYALAGQLIECECCFGNYAWEDMACCVQAHLFCRNCLNSVVQEGLFGQGSLRGKHEVSCISAAAAPACTAAISLPILRNAIMPQLYAELERSQITEYIDKNRSRAGAGLLVCPFCDYCEQSLVLTGTDFWACIIKPSLIGRAFWHVGLVGTVVLFATMLVLLVYEITSSVAAATVLIGWPYDVTLGQIDDWIARETDTIRRLVFKHQHGTEFRCRNPDCGRSSCVDCGAEFRPMHKCYEQEKDRKRIYIEQAMADAVKRTCPACHVSFVKADGCNKLVCVCGYAMCYVCRRDIRDESYRHFCDHFRLIPGSACMECDKCDLYKVEEESKTIERAAREAEMEFVRSSGLPAGWDFKSGPVGNHQDHSRHCHEHHNDIINFIESYLVLLFGVLFSE